MKNIFLKLILTLSLVLTFSCQDVVDIPLENATPKLVIDANLKWQKGTPGDVQTITLSLTNDFYTNAIKAASGATVTVTNNSNVVFNFIEDGVTGNYTCLNFIPALNEQYTLKVNYQGQNYTATNKLYATPVIQGFEQKIVTGFGNKDQIQIKFFYQDNGSEDNFYLVGAKNPNLAPTEYGVIKDEFFQGNIMFGFYTNEKIKKDDQFQFSLQGISNSYFNYMNKLLDISGSQGGSPFSTPPATLRGNITNQSNPDNYPLGYFFLSEIDQKVYTVQ